MTIYLVVPDPGGPGFNVEIVGSDGVRQTLLHFSTEAEAEEWVAAERERDRLWCEPQN